MTRQEEIREGVRDALRQYHNLEMSKLPDDTTDYLCVMQETLINRLDSQGVVKQVDRELPECDPLDINRIEGIEDMLKAGYVAVERLIEKPTKLVKSTQAGELKQKIDGIVNIATQDILDSM